MKTTLFTGAALSLLTVSALAADLGVPAFPAPGAPPFTWTSCYAGGQAGGGWGQKAYGYCRIPGRVWRT